MKKMFVIMSMLAVSGVQAEIQYDISNPLHKKDLECIAALSIARDITFQKDNNLFRQITAKQNAYFLKYDRIPSGHIDARKILIKNEGTFEKILKRCM